MRKGKVEGWGSFNGFTGSGVLEFLTYVSSLC